MSKKGNVALWIVILVVVIIVVGGIWWWMASQNGNAVGYNNTNPSTVTSSTGAQGSTGTNPSGAPQGDSDQAISQDMTSANTQMTGLGSDSANVNQSLNDQPVEQGQ